MKISLRQLVVIVCLLTGGIVLVVPLQVVQSNDFLYHVDVYIDRITHSRGSRTHEVTRVVRHFNLHTEPGSHQHPAPSVTPYFNDASCSSSQCSYCN